MSFVFEDETNKIKITSTSNGTYHSMVLKDYAVVTMAIKQEKAENGELLHIMKIGLQMNGERSEIQFDLMADRPDKLPYLSGYGSVKASVSQPSLDFNILDTYICLWVASVMVQVKIQECGDEGIVIDVYDWKDGNIDEYPDDYLIESMWAMREVAE
ncbi:MAG: hypothetical protein ACTSQA_08005 [Candidatus Heimdallarchaeaceae archaeon]